MKIKVGRLNIEVGIKKIELAELEVELTEREFMGVIEEESRGSERRHELRVTELKRRQEVELKELALKEKEALLTDARIRENMSKY